MSSFSQKPLLDKDEEEMIQAISTRCLLEGCRFGYPGIHKKPLEKCIYCGESVKYPASNWSDFEGKL